MVQEIAAANPSAPAPFSGAAPSPVAGDIAPPQIVSGAAGAPIEGSLSGNKLITALWTNNLDNVTWIAYDSAWRQISGYSSTGNIAMFALAAHAKGEARNCSIRVDSGNNVTEIYVF